MVPQQRNTAPADWACQDNTLPRRANIFAPADTAKEPVEARAMKTLQQLCTPRPSVFETQRRDTVLDLADLTANRIDPASFFEENYVTEGMKILLEQAFRRLEGKSDQGIFKLKQAMGGGKTHNLLTLGLLARHPSFRQRVMGSFYTPDAELGAVRVVAFSGRESDAPFGIWGSIAEQMGKRDFFADLYSPLQAPGQKAWENLLAGESLLILLDELPPYFENARSKAVGNSDLAQVTATALSNLLVALGKESCSRVCLVITDLTAAYAGGSQQISSVLADFERETHRSAMSLEPVRMNSDELYQILRRRIFAQLPPEPEVREVAQGYAKAIRDARQMDITNESPEQFAVRIQTAYPFHPAIRDLYARFRENPGFQQTRGLIRLMRIVTARLWSAGMADKRYLIAAHDLDFNDRETRTEIGQINSSLDNAIAHDIASEGSAVAEAMDANLGGTDSQDASRLLLMASLANVPNAVLGLSIPELVACLAAPGRDLTRLKSDVLEKFATGAWYLHSNRDGKLFFKNVQNLNAKLESLVGAYNAEQAVHELRTRLEKIFAPENGDCYQRVAPLPAVDEIELEQDRVTLVVVEPYAGTGLRPEVKEFYAQTTWKNRVAFLTGSRNTYDQLIDTGKRLRAIKNIQDELKADKLPAGDPQVVQAGELNDRIQGNFHSAVRETFTTLWYPTGSELLRADFRMKFEGNKYSGEKQIVDILGEKMKFTAEVSGEYWDTFRKKCEARLFTAQSLPWSEIRRRAGMEIRWQWHHPKALDDLRAECLLRDVWREQGGFVDRGPFPAPTTGVTVNRTFRDPHTGEVTLRITPVHGDQIFYDVGSDATSASARLDGQTLKTNDLRVSFVVYDSTNQHKTGEVIEWTNEITLKHRFFHDGGYQRLELQAIPTGTIYYTTDGSDPKVTGAVYDEPFVLPPKTLFVLAYATADGVESAVEQLAVHWGKESDVPVVDAAKKAEWKRAQSYNSTKDSYEFLERLKKYRAMPAGVRLSISGVDGDREWLEVNTSGGKQIEPAFIEEALVVLRKIQSSGQVQISADALHFAQGQDLLDWVAEVRATLAKSEIKQ